MSKERKPWFREYLRDDVEKRLGTRIGDLSTSSQSKEMTLYYVRNVLSKIMPGLVSDDEIELGDSIVDGHDDLGVDFAMRSEGRVLIIQSKYRGHDKHEDMDSVSHFCDVLSRLHSAHHGGRMKMNAKLQEVVSDIDWDSDYFHLQFLTLGRVAEGSSIRGRVENGVKLIPGLQDLSDRIEFQFSDEQDLNEKLREALSAGETLDQEVLVHFRPSEPHGNQVAPFWVELGEESGRRMYVGQVSGSELADLYRTYKYRLFSLNIRDYVGETATNKAIIETAKDHPADFLFFNNGVSAVASRIDPDDEAGVLRCSTFSIINGAQTVRSLRKAQVRDKGGMLKNARVLIRISEFSLSKDHDFLTDITRYNNTQNSVKISDFRSNDPVQKDLSRKFQSIVRGGKAYWYKNKRSREARDRVIPVSLEELAKSVHAFRLGPDDVWGGTKYMFELGPKGGYEKVFGLPVSHINEPDFRLLAGSYFACEEVRSLWELNKKSSLASEQPLHPAIERRWMIYFTVGELLRLAYRDFAQEMDDDLRRLSKPQWMDETTSIPKGCLAELYDIAKSALCQTYDLDSKATEDFRHRNWFRSEGTLQKIKSTLGTIPVYRGAKNPLPRLR